MDLEAEKFRAHAEANDRLQVRWDQTFTTWLINAGQFAQRGNGVSAYANNQGSSFWGD